MPFDLKISGQVFIRKLDQVLESVTGKFVTMYIDDLIVASESFEEHVKHLDTVFTKLKDNGLTVNGNKTKICMEELKFLGHIISARGITPCNEKLDAIKNLSAPKTVRQVRGLCGFLNFYRKFIPNFAAKLAPITELLKKKVKFKWERKH